MPYTSSSNPSSLGSRGDPSQAGPSRAGSDRELLRGKPARRSSDGVAGPRGKATLPPPRRGRLERRQPASTIRPLGPTAGRPPAPVRRRSFDSPSRLAPADELALARRMAECRQEREALPHTPEGDARGAELERELLLIRNRFVAANQGLVAHIARRFSGMGLSDSDLLQEGNLGLMRASDKFDYRCEVRFSTYATWWIRQAIRRGLANQARTIRLPCHAITLRQALERERRALRNQLGHDPSDQELSELTGVASERIRRSAELVAEPLSLDAPRRHEDDGSLGDSLADPSDRDAVDAVQQRQDAEFVDRLLAELSPRQRKVVEMRFGLNGQPESTLEAIGQVLGVSRERIRQIVRDALVKVGRITSRGPAPTAAVVPPRGRGRARSERGAVSAAEEPRGNQRG